MHSTIRKIKKMAKSARKHAPSPVVARSAAKFGRTLPRQPDYPDEVSIDQLDAIRKLVDPNGDSEARRTILHSAAW